MITHHYRLTTVPTACLLTLFLLIPSSIAPAQQLTSVDVQAAVKDLKNKDAGVRADAARRLVLLVVKAKTPNLVEAASPALIEALKDSDSKVRNRAVMALGILWSSTQYRPEMNAAIPALAALLKDDYEDTRVRAIYALIGFGADAKPAVPVLTEVAANQSAGPRVREAVRRALEAIEQPTVADIPTLVNKLQDIHDQVRVEAAYDLKSLGANAKPAFSSLLVALKDPEPRVRFFAVLTLNILIDTQSDVGPLITAFIDLLKDRDDSVRWQAASGLEKIGPKARAAVPALTASLSDTAEDVRVYAADALKSIGWDSEITTTNLIKLLKDPSSRVRHSAANALGRVEVASSIALSVLIEDLKDPGERTGAIWALNDFGDRAKDAVPALAEILSCDLPSWHRVEIARLIGRVGPGAKQVVPVLVKSLNDRDESVRVAVAVALLQVEPESEARIQPALLKMAKDRIVKERQRPSSVNGRASGPGIESPRWDEAGDYLQHGMILYQQGRFDAAIENYTKAIEFDPQYSEAYKRRAIIYRARGDHAAAIADFTKAIEVDSEYAQEHYYERGVSQLDNRNYDAAIADFTKAIELDNYYAEAYYSRGLAHYQKKNYDAAMVDFDRALDFVPRLVDVFPARARLKLQQGNIAGSLADFDEAIRANPTNPTSYENRTEALKTQGKLEAAEDFYRAALRGAPDDANLLNRVGYFLVELNKNLPEALQLIQRAVSTRPDDPLFLHSLGWAYFKLGRYDEARRYLQESVRRDLYSPLSLEHLGDVYEQQGDKEGAKAAWSKALSFSTDTNSKTRLKGKLNLTMRL